MPLRPQWRLPIWRKRQGNLQHVALLLIIDVPIFFFFFRRGPAASFFFYLFFLFIYLSLSLSPAPTAKWLGVSADNHRVERMG
jgi:hypothetical protein